MNNRNNFDGSLIENVDKFREVIRKYNEEVKNKCKFLEDRIRKLIKIERVCEDGNKWYLKVLDGKRVVGVDGGQISPLKELGIPVGVVQVAKIWVIHGLGKFGKNYKTALVRMEENLELRRTQLEMEMLIEEMDGKSWLFFDGSLIPYFSDQSMKEAYISMVEKLIKESERTETPLIAYIDKSFSRDLAKIIGVDTYDSFLLSGFMSIFSYTQPFHAQQYNGKVCFSYIMVNPASPVRIEYPAWMESMHDEVVKIVIAECLLGKTRGYPYILERAHYYSRLDSKARMSLMKAIKSHGISFKWISKFNSTP